MIHKNNKLMLGYENLSDLVTTVFGTKCITLNIMGGIIAGASAFITQYVWDDAKAVFILLGLIVLDAITGIFRAIKQKTFSSARLPRVLVIIILYTGLLSIGWNLAHISALYGWIPSILYGGFVTTLFVSIFENIHALGLVPDNIYNYIKTKIDLLQSFVFGANFNKTPIASVNSTKIGIYQTDIDGNMIYVDTRFCEITGLSKEEILNGKMKNLVLPEQYNTMFLEWRNAVKERKNFKFEHNIIRPEGKIINVLSQASPLKDSNGTIIGYLGSLEQIN